MSQSERDDCKSYFPCKVHKVRHLLWIGCECRWIGLSISICINRLKKNIYPIFYIKKYKTPKQASQQTRNSKQRKQSVSFQGKVVLFFNKNGAIQKCLKTNEKE